MKKIEERKTFNPDTDSPFDVYDKVTKKELIIKINEIIEVLNKLIESDK